MGCYHPLKRFLVPNAKGGGVVTSNKCVAVVSNDNSRFFPVDELVDRDQFKLRFTDFDYIPCGHCIGCRLDYSLNWANRMLLELKYHESACFLTLTYDDFFLPVPRLLYNTEGEVIADNYSPLCKEDLQKFFKRLRRRIDRSDNPHHIMYYACGEYGSDRGRPHYHVILFGYDFPDRKFHYRRNNFNHYISDELRQLWPYGLHDIGDVSFDTCAYTARYVTKKLLGISKYDLVDFVPEFSLMSRKPAIGKRYYEDHKEDIYKDSSNQEIIVSTEAGSRIIRPPKYYDNMFDVDYPVKFEEIKQNRKDFAIYNNLIKGNLCSLSYEEQLLAEEAHKKDKIKSLRRSLK